MVKANHNAALTRSLGNFFHIDELCAAVEHAGQQRQADVVGKGGDDVVLVDELSIAAFDELEALLGVVAVQANLAFDGIVVGGKVEIVHDDFVALGRGMIEGGHRLMDVHGGVGGHRDLIGVGPDE